MTLAYASPYRMPATMDPANREPIGGAEVLTPDGRSLPFAGAKLRIEAGAGIARVVLEQTFENPFAETLRVTYKMPLPVSGAVSGYAFRIGTRTITGKVDRKESARARFEEAIVQGRTAALLEQDKADVFTQEIGNVPPGRTIVAEITIDQRLSWLPEGEWELRFPTVIGPRYMEANLTAAQRKASHVEVAEGGGVRARVQLEAKISDALTPGRRVESPSHLLVARPDGVVELTDTEGSRLDRDVVLRWAVAKRDVGLSLQVARPDGAAPHGRNAYGLLSIVPPAPDAGYAAVPRDLIVLLDTSGSMDGPPLEQAKRVVASLIDSLSEKDRLEVIEFSMSPNRYTQGPVPGTKREKERAIHWVMQRRANGGTEMQSAIYDALKTLRRGAQRQVVLVTDGYVGGEEQIVAMLHERLPEGCRMHVVGVGSGVNRALATSIARAGRGAEVLVGLDEDAERCAASLVDKTRAPVLTDLVISGDALVEHAPEHIPDVFAGSPIVAALKLRASGGELFVRGNLATGQWTQKISVPRVDPGEGNGAIVALFGRESVADLEVRWSIGRETAAIDREIESIGIVFQIATRRTSWVAIDEDRSVDPRLGSQHVEIPQELPYGTTAASFGLAGAQDLGMLTEGADAMEMTMAAPLSSLSSLEAPARAMSYMGHFPASLDDEDADDASMTQARAPMPRPAASMPQAPARDTGSFGIAPPMAGGAPAEKAEEAERGGGGAPGDRPTPVMGFPAAKPQASAPEPEPFAAMKARSVAPGAPPAAPRAAPPPQPGYGAPPPAGPAGAQPTPPPMLGSAQEPIGRSVESRSGMPHAPSQMPSRAQMGAPKNRWVIFALVFALVLFLVGLAIAILSFLGR